MQSPPSGGSCRTGRYSVSSRPDAPPGTSLGDAPRDPPSQSPKADHRHHAIPGLAGGSSFRSGWPGPSGGQPGPVVGHDRTKAPIRPPTSSAGTRSPASSTGAGSLRAGHLPVHRLLGSDRRSCSRHSRQSPGDLLSRRSPILLIWSHPEDWVGRDGIFVESVRAPGTLSNFRPFFARYESIGTVQVVRRGVLIREVYLYRGILRPGRSPSTAVTGTAPGARSSRIAPSPPPRWHAALTPAMDHRPGRPKPAAPGSLIRQRLTQRSLVQLDRSGTRHRRG